MQVNNPDSSGAITFVAEQQLRPQIMKNTQILDLYSDYCLSSFLSVTAVGLSELLDQGYSHDQISRFLSQKTFTQQDFWKFIKRLIRKVEHSEGTLVIDDTISEKPHSTENALSPAQRGAYLPALGSL